jgi:hypothetical protein
MSRALGEIVEEALHGALRDSVLFASCYARALASEARASGASPAAFFTLDGCESGIELPALPLPAAYEPGRGWAVSVWVRLAPGAGAGGAPLTLARFWSAAGGGCEAELALAPTDSPALWTLSARVAAAGGGFRAGARRGDVSARVRLHALRWHHVAFSQSAPVLFKAPRGTLYADGRALGDAELPCPPLPFSRGAAGARARAALAHLALWGERLPPAHVAAIFARGPNARSLHHALALPLSANAPADVRRAGLIGAAPLSLDALHEGLPRAAR